VYPSFVALLTGRDSVKPKERPLPWVMRLIEEVYDSRYAKDTADLKGGDEDGGAPPPPAAQPFPAFLLEFFSKRYGLRSLIEQNCWDLLYNVHRLRKESLDVEIFGRFVEEYYDPDDLLFFTYVRSMVQKELGVNFRARWSEMGRNATAEGGAASPAGKGGAPGGGGLPPPLTLTHRECQLVSRVVFGSESDPLFRTFMAMVERHMTHDAKVAAARAKTTMGLPPDARRMDVTTFLHTALVEYHETRPAEGGGAGAGGDDALLREAESAYAARGGDAGGGGSPGGGAGAPPAVRPSPALLEALGETMHRSNEAYLDRALGAPDAAALPREVQAQIRQEVQAQLEAKVDAILAAVITVTQGAAGGSSGSPDVDALAKRFAELVAGAGGHHAPPGAVQAFCDGVLASGEVRATVEQLVQLLVQYAASRLKEASKA